MTASRSARISAGAIGDSAVQTEIWLRDGRPSVPIDASEIISVISAGNYVEHELTDRRKHLIRSTLHTEQARLAPFGIARVHLTLLIDLKRIVALGCGPSGDFKVSLDTGEWCPAANASRRPPPG